MKSQLTRVLFSFLLVTAILSLAVAHDSQPSPNTIVVGSGNDLRCRLDKSLRITKPGEQISGRLLEPVYIGTVLAIAAGATMQGHVSSVSTAPLSKRTGRLLRGDLTPPRTARVTFERLVLSDGTALPVHTDTIVGISGVKTAQYLPHTDALSRINTTRNRLPKFGRTCLSGVVVSDPTQQGQTGKRHENSTETPHVHF